MSDPLVEAARRVVEAWYWADFLDLAPLAEAIERLRVVAGIEDLAGPTGQQTEG